MTDSLDGETSGNEEIRRRVAELEPWFHNLDLRGVKTAPSHFLGDYPAVKWRRFQHALPGDLRGLSVLDVGCNAGFYAFELERRGSPRVLGIDTDARYLQQARLAAAVGGSSVEFRHMSVYDVSSLGERFDLVLFMGVIYHLRHPLLALDLLHRYVVKDMLVFQSLLRGEEAVAPLDKDYPFTETAVFERPGFPKLHFVEKKYSGDRTNWWVPNRACAEAMLRSAGFEILSRPSPEDEVYLCRRHELTGEASKPIPFTFQGAIRP